MWFLRLYQFSIVSINRSGLRFSAFFSLRKYLKALVFSKIGDAIEKICFWNFLLNIMWRSETPPYFYPFIKYIFSGFNWSMFGCDVTHWKSDLVITNQSYLESTSSLKLIFNISSNTWLLSLTLYYLYNRSHLETSFQNLSILANPSQPYLFGRMR